MSYFRRLSLCILFILALCGEGFCDAVIVKGKTGIESIDTLPTYEWDVATAHKSLAATMLWSILPGGGQFYTGHYIRGGFISAIELGLTYEVFFNQENLQQKRFDQAKEFQDSVAVYTRRMLDSRDSLKTYQSRRNDYAERIRELSDKKIESEDLRKSELAWLVGLQVYGMFDAYGIWVNDRGHSVERRDIKGALYRALVPGWGQIYNQEYGKAGLLYMGLFGAAVSIGSRQHVVNYYLDRKHALEAENSSSDELDVISEQILYYRKNRNQYIWGISLIYMYSIADAVVDAMLSDFDNPAHLALLPGLDGGFRAALSVDF